MSQPTGEFSGSIDSWSTQEMLRQERLTRGMRVANAIQGEIIHPDEDHIAAGLRLESLPGVVSDGTSTEA